MLAGRPFSFRVSDAGALGAGFQWLREGQAISGARDSVYSVPAARLRDAGNYRCVAIDALAPDTSKPAALKVSLPAPEAAPAAGEFADTVRVKLTPALSAYAILYSRNGGRWTAYAGAVLLSESTVLRAVAVLSGDTGAIGTWDYSRKTPPSKPGKPLATPAGGAFQGQVGVTLSPPSGMPEGLLIYYTLDGTFPDTLSTRYMGNAIVLDSSAAITAAAYQPGAGFGSSMMEIYHVVPAIPSVEPAEGKYAGGIQVALTAPNPAARIFYTLDGSLPDAAKGSRYLGPIPVDSTRTVKAVAVTGSGPNDAVSAVLSAAYQITKASDSLPDKVTTVVLAPGYTLTQGGGPGTSASVEVVPVDKLGQLLGFRNLLFAFRISSAGAGPISAFNYEAPNGSASALYRIPAAAYPLAQRLGKIMSPSLFRIGGAPAQPRDMISIPLELESPPSLEALR